MTTGEMKHKAANDNGLRRERPSAKDLAIRVVRAAIAKATGQSLSKAGASS